MSEKVAGVPVAETPSGQNTEGEGVKICVPVPEAKEGGKMADQQQSEAVAEKSEASDAVTENLAEDNSPKGAESTEKQADAAKAEEKTTEVEIY